MSATGGLTTHAVSIADFEALAAGYGDGTVVRELRGGQLSKNLHLLLALDRAAETAGTAFPAGFALLVEVQDAAPKVFAELLTHPHVSAWLAHCVRMLWPPSVPVAAPAVQPVVASAVQPVAAPAVQPVATVLGHLAGIAAAGAIAAGVEFAVTVPARDGVLLLPGVGRARVPGSSAVVVASGADGLTIDGRAVALDQADDRWEPVHRLVAEAGGLRLAVTLDDLDWYRGQHGLPAADRLDLAAVDRWRRLLVDAWDLLVRDHRRYAESIAVGLRTLVPLRRDLIDHGVSATSTDSFGVVFLSEPPDHTTLAVALVHEFQHGKLAALMDLVPILVSGDGPRYYAPWREDPRPLPGLLQGAYAFLAVTDFWRVRRGAAVGGSGYPHFEFARWREQLLQVLQVLAESGRLTAAGREFLVSVRATVDGWRTGAVPQPEDRLARTAARDHRLAWRMRNLRCRPESVDRLASAWLAGETRPPAVELTTETVVGVPRFHQCTRLQLTALRIKEPATFERLVAAPSALRAELPEATDADLAYVNDEYETAAARYRALLEHDADNLAHWAGLILALDDLGADPAAAAVLHRAPEWVVAVHRAVLASGAQAVDPAALARWLAPALDERPLAVTG